MPENYSWKTEISCYETAGDKPFHLDITASSPLGSTHMQLDAVSVAEILSAITKFRLGAIYNIMVERAPIVSVKSTDKGIPLEKREEDLVLKALRGE